MTGTPRQFALALVLWLAPIVPATATPSVAPAATATPTATPAPAPAWDAAAWQGWDPAGAEFTELPAVVSWGAGRLDMLARSSDTLLWHRSYDGGRWNTWEPLGQALASRPAVASWGPGRLDVFVQGNDHALYHEWWDGSRWGLGDLQGGSLSSAPAAVSWGANRVDVFVRGSDTQLWHKFWDLSLGGWSSWQPLGGGLTSAPAVASWGPNRLDVFVRGTDTQLWHKAWDGSSWGGWEPLGGGLGGEPGAVSGAPNRIDVLVRGTDTQLWRKSWTGAGWTDFEPLGGGLTSGPDALSTGAGVLDVLVRGTDNALWHKRLEGGAWTAWTSMAGIPASNQVADVPYFRQVYALSCEEAALEMALAHQVIGVDQVRELSDIGVDLRPAFIANDALHWGDPYVNFVGDPNGSEVDLTGYGTYFAPIARVTSAYGGSALRAGEGIAPQDLYAAVLENHPAVAWVSFDWTFHAHSAWQAFDGRLVQYEGPVEHAVTVVGVRPDAVFVFNPWFGPQWVSKASFEAAYETYNRMAVIMQ